MNSTAIGEGFEDEVYSFISQEINNNRFWISKERCKVFKRKGYYSEKRGKEIKFDVSIEVYLPGKIPDKDKYSLLILIECKNKAGTIEAGDVEKFESTVRQVSGLNVKGIFATTSALQLGAINFAASSGIGLIRYFKPDKFQWELHRNSTHIFIQKDQTDASQIYQALTNDDFESDYGNFYCFINDQFTRSTNKFFEAVAKSNETAFVISQIDAILMKMDAISIKFQSADNIEYLVKSILNTINYNGGCVNLDQICDWQNKEKNLETNIINSTYLDKNKNEILGKIVFNPTKITLFASQKELLGRRRFTLAHELGHHFLDHGRLLISEYVVDEDFKNPNNALIRRLEYQANIFASKLLMPSDFFVEEYIKIMRKLEIYNRRNGKLYLDHQPCNLDNFIEVTNHLINIFEVSRSAVKYRLLFLNFLEDVHTPKKLRSLLRMCSSQLSIS